MKMYVGITDYDWFKTLKQANCDEVNFWKPGGRTHIGCIILSIPFYFNEQDWIPVPKDWSRNIVQGKTYNTGEVTGMELYQQVQDKLRNQNVMQLGFIATEDSSRYGKEQLIKPRIGQGAFKVLITDAYQRRCAITGEKTLPVLEAAHIKPYSL